MTYRKSGLLTPVVVLNARLEAWLISQIRYPVAARLCKLAAYGALTAEGSVQAGGGEGTDGAGIGAWEIICFKL